jgi:hypothetical protein
LRCATVTTITAAASVAHATTITYAASVTNAASIAHCASSSSQYFSLQRESDTRRHLRTGFGWVHFSFYSI